MRLDRNGYAPSILPTSAGTCFACGRTGDTARHEIYGAANRKTSKAHGFWVNICPNCHNIVHLKYDDGVLDRELKKMCQLTYERTHSRDEFMELIGKNYD